MNRIICIGNRFLDEDSLGPRVYDILSHGKLPAGVELIEGGLAGLDLLRWMDGCERVIFVDAMVGGDESRVHILHASELATDNAYGHAGGLAYLLGAYHALAESPETRVYVVGAGTPQVAETVAGAALAVARGEEVRP